MKAYSTGRIDSRRWRVFVVWALLCISSGCSKDGSHSHVTLDAGSHARCGTPIDAGADAGASPSAVTIADGVLRGEARAGACRFLGIPYAKPPVGDLRWKAPVKNDPWNGTRDATAFANRCAQTGDSVSGTQTTDEEDCLYLNVWTPDTTPARGAPVMLWLHGGGNQGGSASDTYVSNGETLLQYDGQGLASKRGVVVVTVDYRLGALGFFAHPALDSEGSPSGNQGILDQQRALEWVRDNIGAFGGDPSNVTIFGESSGSVDTCFHMVAPGSRGLFHRALGESGGCTAHKTPLAQAESEAQEFAKAVGCTDPATLLSCLRGKTPAALRVDAPAVRTSTGSDGGAGDAGIPDAAVVAPGGGRYDGTRPLWWFGAIVDGKVIPDQPSILFDSGSTAKVPYLLGSNADEGTLFHFQQPPVVDQIEYLAALTRRFGDRAPEILSTYPVTSFASAEAALERVTGDSELVCETHDTARRAVASGLNVHLYNFAVPVNVPGLESLGATHSSEIVYVFGVYPFARSERRALSDAMQGYWRRFASAGDPNGASPTWPGFSPANDKRLQFDIDVTQGVELESVVTDFRMTECTLWRTFYGTFDPSRPGSR